MNKLSTERRAAIVAALVDGCSIRATCCMTGASKNTVSRLLAELEAARQRFHDQTVTGLKCKRIQCDEIWSFVYAKEKNAPDATKAAGTAGDVWTWTAIEAQSKLIASWMVGGRDAGYAYEFMQDVAGRLTGRVQLTAVGAVLFARHAPTRPRARDR